MNEDEHMTMIDDCEKRESRMTEWEATFIDSISSQIGKENQSSNNCPTVGLGDALS